MFLSWMALLSCEAVKAFEREGKKLRTKFNLKDPLLVSITWISSF